MLDSVTSELAPVAAETVAEFDPRSLVQHELIRAAEARLAALAERLADAKQAEAAARSAVVIAERQRTAALVGDVPSLTITVADEGHREAIRQHQLALDTVAALERAHAHCRMIELPAARRAATIPMARWCLAERLAAARDADAARAALARADARTVRANSLLQFAKVIDSAAMQSLLYSPRPIEPHLAYRVTNSEAEELSLQSESDLADLAS